jgi:outer membrane lipoprotein carrier protein
VNAARARASKTGMNGILRSGLALALCWAAAGAAGANGTAEPAADAGAARPPACLERTVDAIQARYESVRDFSARFEQTTRPAHTGASAAQPVASRGRVVVAKPSRMRWSYETPEPSLVVSDGETLWIYDPGFGEAQRLPVDEGFLSGAAVQFLLGQGDMRREFAISLVGSCAAERVELELVPREPASYEKLRVVASPVTGDLARTEVHDLLGNVTVVAFSQLEFNRDPPAATFRFDPPDGVTVVDLSDGRAPAP